MLGEFEQEGIVRARAAYAKELQRTKRTIIARQSESYGFAPEEKLFLRYQDALKGIRAAIRERSKISGRSTEHVFGDQEIRHQLKTLLSSEEALGVLAQDVVQIELDKRFGIELRGALLKNKFFTEAMEKHTRGFNFDQTPIPDEHPLFKTNGTGVPFRGFIIYGMLDEIIWFERPPNTVLTTQERRLLQIARDTQLITCRDGRTCAQYEVEYRELGANIGGCMGSFANTLQLVTINK